MRKFAIILLVVLAISVAFESCGRYENGPAFSLRSARARVVGEWILTDLLVNDKHEQTLFDKESSSVLELNDDGTYSYDMMLDAKSPNEMVGQWLFGEDKTELILNQFDTINGNSEHSYKIIRLTKAEMWLVNGGEEYAGIDDLIERHFEKKEE